MITYDDFKKVEMKVGKILTAAPVEKSEKLLRLTVDLGETETAQTETGEFMETPKVRQVVSGIAKSYAPEDLIGQQFVFVINLEPRMIMGLESQAMIMAANSDEGPVALVPKREVLPGATIQ